MLTSLLLSEYKVPHCLLERRKEPTKHPQAHFMHSRTMEIFQTHLPDVYREILLQKPDSRYWRDFVYCYSVMGREYTRLDQLATMYNDTSTKQPRTSHWNHTPSNVAHLPQSCLENILRKELHRRNEGKHDDEPQEEEKMNGCGYGDIRFGETLRSIEPLANGKGSKLTLESGQFIHCDYLIGADGAHSQVREHMKVDMCGQEALQTLINVHFTCDGLGEYLGVTSSVDKTRGGDGITTKMPIMEVGCGAPSRLEQALYMEAREDKPSGYRNERSESSC